MMEEPNWTLNLETRRTRRAATNAVYALGKREDAEGLLLIRDEITDWLTHLGADVTQHGSHLEHYLYHE